MRLREILAVATPALGPGQGLEATQDRITRARIARWPWLRISRQRHELLLDDACILCRGPIHITSKLYPIRNPQLFKNVKQRVFHCAFTDF